MWEEGKKGQEAGRAEMQEQKFQKSTTKGACKLWKRVVGRRA